MSSSVTSQKSKNTGENFITSSGNRIPDHPTRGLSTALLLNYLRWFFSSRLILSLRLLEDFLLLYKPAGLFQYMDLFQKNRKNSRPRRSPRAPDSMENVKLKNN